MRHFSRRLFSSKINEEYCFNLVKQHDYENYLLGLLLPSSSSSSSSFTNRRSFYSIHSFNIEMASIKHSINNNKKAGQLRYKWWIDYLNNVYNGEINRNSNVMNNYQHPVAEELFQTIQTKQLSKRWLEYLIEARMQDILSPQFETLSNLEDYVEKSHSSLNYLTLEILNVNKKYPEEIDHMASHIGVAFGLVSVIRGTAVDISQVKHYKSLLPLLLLFIFFLLGSIKATN